MFFLLFSLCYSYNVLAASDTTDFYKAPTFSNFNKNLSFPDSKLEDYSKRLMHVWIELVLKQCSECRSKLTRDHYKSYSADIQDIIVDVLFELNDYDTLDKIGIEDLSARVKSKYHVDLDNLVLRKRVCTNEDVVFNADTADALFAAFGATGDNKYLMPILKYLTSENTIVRQIAREFLNREQMAGMYKNVQHTSQELIDLLSGKDLFDAISKQDPNGTDCLEYRVRSYRTILWAISSAQFRDVVKKMIDVDASLDFYSDIKL